MIQISKNDSNYKNYWSYYNDSDNQLYSCVEALKLLKLLYYRAIILHPSTNTLSPVTQLHSLPGKNFFLKGKISARNNFGIWLHYYILYKKNYIFSEEVAKKVTILHTLQKKWFFFWKNRSKNDNKLHDYIYYRGVSFFGQTKNVTYRAISMVTVENDDVSTNLL